MFLGAVRKYLIVSLCSNAVYQHPEIFGLVSELFLFIFDHFPAHLKVWLFFSFFFFLPLLLQLGSKGEGRGKGQQAGKGKKGKKRRKSSLPSFP